MRRFFIGIASGVVVGYAAIRAREAYTARTSPPPSLAADPKAYGSLRRGLMLASLGRNLALLAATAFALGPVVEVPEGTREPRARRLALVATYFAAVWIIDLPSDYVEEILLERRYGLSKQTDRDWLADKAKGFGITLVLMLAIMELLATAIDRLPRTWPIVATAASFPLLILANIVFPTFIAPLFNTFEPIEGDVAERIRELAGRFGAGDATLLRVNMSKQTEKANAYVTGLLGTKRIVIGDTLLDVFEPDETMFVVAHELGHYVQKDVWRGVSLGTLASAVVFFGSGRLAVKDESPLASSAGLARLLFWMTLLSMLAGPPLSAFSRERERAADRFALDATQDGMSGAKAFTRLAERNLAEGEQPKWMELLFSSHPSLRSRIERLSAAAASA